MRTRALVLIGLVSGLLFCGFGCGSDTGSQKRDLVKYLENTNYCNQVFYGGKIYIRNQMQSSLVGDDPQHRVFDFYYLNILKTAQGQGLLTFQEINEGGWNQWLTLTQVGMPYMVTLSKKLLDIAEKRQNGDCVFKFGHIEIEKIISGEPYTGPLVTSGEKARLVLGVYRNTPTENSRILGSLVPQKMNEYRFRAVMRFDDFNKEWKIVAFDYGFMNTDTWQSNTVH